MATRIAVRRDTAANWATANPVLTGGEIGWETNTGVIRLGDGVTPFTSLPILKADMSAASTSYVAGVTGTAVGLPPSLTQAQIQALINAAPAGTPLVFAGTYALSGPIVIPADNMFIDARNATFTQSQWGQPGFDAIGRNGCTFDVGMIQFVGVRGAMGATYRGSATYINTCGIYINGDRNYVRRLRTSGMVCGVFLSSWNGTSSVDRVGVANRIGQVEADNANFGLLYVGQQDLIIDDLYAHDDLDDSAGANPTHVIYCSATTAFRSTGGQFKSLRGKNILNGQPFQIKYHDGLSIESLLASNSKGFLNIIDSDDLSVGRGTSLNTLFNGNQGAITFQSTNNFSQRPKLGPIYIQQAANVDERVVNILCDYGDFDRLSIDSNHSAGVNPATLGEILVRGVGNRLRRPTIRSLGAGAVPGIWVGFGATANNTIVEQATVTGCLNVGKVDSSSTGVVFEFDSIKQSFTGGTAVDVTGGNKYSSTTAAPATLSTFGDHAALALMLAAGTITVGAANNVLQMRVTPRRNITVTSLTWWSATQGGNYDIGLVDDTTNAVLWTKGSTAWPAAGKITETVPNIVLLAGRTYRVVFSSDGITGLLRGVQVAFSGIDQRLDGSTTSSTASAAFPLPVSTLAAGGAGSTNRIPLIVFGGV